MDVWTASGIIILTSIVVYFSGKKFAESSSKIGDYLHLPRSVKGATFDAVSGSLPEFMVALFSVLVFKKFEVGIGTIAGSALFNLLVIPGLCVLVAPVAFKVSREVISRDGMFYNISVFVLLAALLYSRVWGLIIPIIFLAVYAWYLRNIFKHSKEHKNTVEQSKESKNITLWKELLNVFFNLIIMGIATYFLTAAAINFSEAIGVPAIIIAFTIVAAATSLPDTIVSFVNAKKGNIDDAASNVFGSNIFDILIGLGIPLLIAYSFTGPIDIVFDQIEIVIGLLGATILVLYFLAESHTLHKKQAWFMLFMYVVFLAYIVFLGINGF